MRVILLSITMCFLAVASNVNAHTSAVGYHNSGPGCVTIWFQSWHSAGSLPLMEGSLSLEGVGGNPFPITTVPFTLNTTVKPPLLVDGVNNFYACNSNPAGFCLTDEDGNGGSMWQGAEFCGLQAGDYEFNYIPIAAPSATWEPATPGVQTNVFSLSGAVVGGTSIPTAPQWALILLSIALGAFGVGVLRRRNAA